MKCISRAFLVVMVLLGGSVAWGYAQRPTRDIAWGRLVRANPAVADDLSIGWRERLILYALTPEQAEAYFKQGAGPQSLLLEDGRTLEEYLDAKLSPPASVYVGLPVPCALFSCDQIEGGTRYSLRVRGGDLGAQGGSTTGCGIPVEATAVILNLRLQGAEAGSRVKLWAADGPEPSESALQVADGSAPAGQGTVVVSLAAADQTEGELLLRGSTLAAVGGEVVGYFRAMRVGDAPGGGVSFYTEGSGNNFFGDGAGDSNTSGYSNSFFGGDAGFTNTSGDANSFFGHFAGFDNSTGSYNSFFGTYAGGNNTTGSRNVFVGDSAGRYNTDGVDNAFFGRVAGYSNSNGSANVFVGYRSGYSNMSGNQNAAIGTQAGENATGSNNSFVGFRAGFGATPATDNTASSNSFFGVDSGYSNTAGSNNVFLGRSAGYSNTTGYENVFAGYRAGFNNTQGYHNAFFGRDAGYSNTLGDLNSFFGAYAGTYSTEGGYNTFVGRSAGLSNTVESFNSLLGAFADGAAGITNATAIGYAAQVSQSNSLVLGSINGLNGASADVSVGIGTTTPAAPLHVYRADGTALIKVEETSGTTANRVLFRLTNNGAPWFKLLNSNTAQEWTFAMDQYDNFIFSRIGTGGAEFKIYQSGEVVMGPGGSEVFDLQPTGDLEITGSLTAGGIYYASDRNLKENFMSVDTRQVLEKVAALDITRWNYRSDEAQTPHLGPMAQDFYAAFGLGGGDKTISASDISGVALAAIQGLQQELQEKDAQLKAQGARMQALEDRLAKMEALITMSTPGQSPNRAAE